MVFNLVNFIICKTFLFWLITGLENMIKTVSIKAKTISILPSKELLAKRNFWRNSENRVNNNVDKNLKHIWMVGVFELDKPILNINQWIYISLEMFSGLWILPSTSLKFGSEPNANLRLNKHTYFFFISSSNEVQVERNSLLLSFMKKKKTFPLHQFYQFITLGNKD